MGMATLTRMLILPDLGIFWRAIDDLGQIEQITVSLTKKNQNNLTNQKR